MRTTSAGALPLVFLLAACSREQAAPATAQADIRVVRIQELVALVKSNLGRGALVNVWATW